MKLHGAPQIVVLGSINMDLSLRVAHLPKPGETVIGRSLDSNPGGKGANQAVAAARMGCTVSMVGRVGTDDFGSFLIAGLQSEHVNVDGVERDPQQPTGTALIVVDERGQNQIAVAPGANGTVGTGEVQRALAALRNGGLLLLQLEVPLGAVGEAATKASGHAVIVLNAAPAQALPATLLTAIDVLLVNEIEAEDLTGMSSKGPREAAIAGARLRESGPRAVVITLGPFGAVLCDSRGEQHVPTQAIEAADSTGAGDAFAGALAASLSWGLDLSAAVKMANRAGSVAVSRRGAQTSLPYARDLEPHLPRLSEELK